MSLNPELEGRSFPPLGPYFVGREKIREFTRAVLGTNPINFDVDAARAAGHADVVALPTFTAVVMERATAQLLSDPSNGLDPTRVIHGSDKASYSRHIVAGDELTVSLSITSVKERENNAIIRTSSEIHDSQARHVATIVSTLYVRGENV